MEITFEKVNNEYIAEFEITTDSNLHIEKKCAASTKLYQRTNGGGWDLVDETKNMQGAVDDFDLSALVYPKFIKVVCNAEPLYAEVTTSGEVTEIKSQSKEIEVTSNGTTEVTPDAGFAYLNSVKVKTNVAQSGGGGGSASDGNTYEYIDVRIPSDWQGEDFTGSILTPLILNCSLLVKANIESMQVVTTAGQLLLGGTSLIENVTAIAVDINMEVFNGTGYSKVGDLIKEIGVDSLPRLTKEEFYTL